MAPSYSFHLDILRRNMRIRETSLYSSTRGTILSTMLWNRYISNDGREVHTVACFDGDGVSKTPTTQETFAEVKLYDVGRYLV